MSEPKFIVFDKTEKVIESWLKGCVSFLFLILSIYISRDSTFWLYITGLIFLLVLVGRVSVAINNRRKTFKSKAELQAWVDTL